MSYGFGAFFPFRCDNRKPNGTWDAPDATDDNIRGTSVDRYDPVWPRWKQKPPPHGEGEFISEEPFFDIDEISRKAEFCPPGRLLVDKNLGGNPASRQRVGDMPGGNPWRRRLLVGGVQEGETYPDSSKYSESFAADTGAIQLAGAAPPRPSTAPRAPAPAPQMDFNENDVDLLARLVFAEAGGQFRAPGAYLGVGNTVLNRLKARGFPKTLQGVILGRTASGAPQFAGTQNRQWRDAANPAALTGPDANRVPRRARDCQRPVVRERIQFRRPDGRSNVLLLDHEQFSTSRLLR